jgi:uncharacterized Rossmann fold enzyme
MDYYSKFKTWYFKIIKEFSFDYKKDCESRDYLSSILKIKGDNWNLEHVLSLFKDLIEEKNMVFIYGCGPSLEETVSFIKNEFGIEFFEKCLNLAADGASVLLREKGIPINGIFSDLDGISKKEFQFSDFIIVHAHGDNIELINSFKENILEFKNIIGTAQVEPLDNIINPGGFTDGDRILFFLRSLLCTQNKLFLIGMDFDKIIGKYSKFEMSKHKEGGPIKVKKLKYAVELIEWLIDDLENEIYFVNSKKVSEKFNYLSIEDFKEMFFY